MRRSTTQFFLLAAFAAALPLATAQTNGGINPATKAVAMASSLPGYDVVAIHQNNSGKSFWTWDTPDNSYTAENCPFVQIVRAAYNLGSPDLISGISGPLASARFDIRAKVLTQDGDRHAKLTDEQLQAMLIPVLAERFHLRVHIVPEPRTVLEIVVAKGGPKFKLTQPETHTGSISFRFSGQDNSLVAKRATISALADILAQTPLQQLIVDHTGLKGEGDFTLKWSSEQAQDEGDPNAVSIYTAIQEQLGLKLVPAKAPVDTLVIDHAEMPTPN